ncbi:universal stress protein UspA [Nesterenkonia sp. AN1]|uniref:Nucleotide-binding universal stress UspA family protein n=1 Tax=Nesterenkonia aurantiaca TaxID=1436010 RepID=A0A4R7G6C8_9MICC|nr:MULTISPECIES: universal stress protein [Nesterenkonia]EXF23997.1 universal stress protein UspA [Nesterenkonia sp. AN1]TDS86921.1 nucleotide-binding universal stress UspA family protein [Nesterenkonia aurantiaca]
MNIDTHSAPRPRAFNLAAQGLGVLVGFDGSTRSLLALHYGALEAQRSRRVLTVITAVSGPIPVYTTLGALPEKFETQAAIDAAGIVLNDARRYLQAYPGKVTYRTEQGEAAAVLAELSTVAELAILGARGRGGFLGRILGSVASALPAHAHCPTIVVPRHYAINVAEGAARFAPQADSRPVIVGIDGSAQSRVAALHAARAAQDRGVALHLLMTLPSLEGWWDWYPDLDPLDQDIISRRQSQLERSLQAEAAWLHRHFPSLAVTASVKPGDPVTQLSKSAQEAQLTVVGTRGRGTFSGNLLGSVSRGVLLRATGPVMVVPDLQDDRLRDQPGPIR